MKVCRYCLQAIESHEGHQRKEKFIYIDAYDEDKETEICDWCDEKFSPEELYVI